MGDWRVTTVWWDSFNLVFILQYNLNSKNQTVKIFEKCIKRQWLGTK